MKEISKIYLLRIDYFPVFGFCVLTCRFLAPETMEKLWEFNTFKQEKYNQKAIKVIDKSNQRFKDKKANMKSTEPLVQTVRDKNLRI